ncbi:MAG: tagatose-6-phosphate ketose isomerase [Acidobacteriota bacterium]
MKLSNGVVRAGHTWSEIVQQPEVWPTTLARVDQAVAQYGLASKLAGARVLLTGAGTSAYASAAVAAGWPGAMAVASTDLLVDTERLLADATVVISVARSGNSPESMATVERIHRLRPDILQLAITCNAEGSLARSSEVQAIVLDPRTDDKSLVMTSSFSNLVLAGYTLADRAGVEAVLPAACANASACFDEIDSAAKRVANSVKDRIVLLASSPLFAWAQEGALKALEMTAGRYPVLAETFLGLRHGPMSFLGCDTVVVCLLSNAPIRRRYELDLVEELRKKELGFLVGVGATGDEAYLFDEHLPAIVAEGADELRVPFEIVGAQLLGYHLSLRSGLDPDNPSVDGVINRVVHGVRIYGEP